MPPSSPGLQYLGTGALAHATFNGVIVASFSRSTLRSIRSSQARLQVHPELLGRTEVSRQTDRGVGGDASLSAHDLVDPPSGAPIDTERSFCVMPYLSMKSCIRNSPGVIGPMRRWPQARTSPVSTSSIGLDPSDATNGDGSATSHSSAVNPVTFTGTSNSSPAAAAIEASAQRGTFPIKSRSISFRKAPL